MDDLEREWLEAAHQSELARLRLDRAVLLFFNVVLALEVWLI